MLLPLRIDFPLSPCPSTTNIFLLAVLAHVAKWTVSCSNGAKFVLARAGNAQINPAAGASDMEPMEYYLSDGKDAGDKLTLTKIEMRRVDATCINGDSAAAGDEEEESEGDDDSEDEVDSEEDDGVDDGDSEGEDDDGDDDDDEDDD